MVAEKLQHVSPPHPLEHGLHVGLAARSTYVGVLSLPNNTNSLNDSVIAPGHDIYIADWLY